MGNDPPPADTIPGARGEESPGGKVRFRLDPAGIVRTTMSGTITVQDVLAHIEARAAAGLMGHPQIVDGMDAQFALSTADLTAIAALIGRLRAGMSPPRTAFVTQRDAAYGVGRMYEGVGQRQDPGFASFRTMAEAERWIQGVG